MTTEELNALVAKISEMDTQIAACDQKARESNEAAAAFNLANRQARTDATTLRKAAEPYKAKLAEYVAAENKRLKDEAAAKAKAAAEAKAKEPAPKSQLDLLTEQVAALTKALEAKG